MIAKTALCGIVLSLYPVLVPTNDVPTNDEGKPDAKPESTPEAKQQARPQTEPEAKQESNELDLLPIEKNIIKYTNARRAKYGLAALEIDHGLMESARQQASWMARNRRLVHTRRPVAENIAMGQPHSRSAVRDWMNSSGHRANILNRGYRRIGAAAYRTREGTIYWCQQFRR